MSQAAFDWTQSIVTATLLIPRMAVKTQGDGKPL